MNITLGTSAEELPATPPLGNVFTICLSVCNFNVPCEQRRFNFAENVGTSHGRKRLVFFSKIAVAMSTTLPSLLMKK
jgi:hypothetical protein